MRKELLERKHGTWADDAGVIGYRIQNQVGG